MQNWKIKRMSYKRLGEWLKAIDQMISNYKGKIKLISCSLCEPCDNHCPGCIWQIMENITCCDFQAKVYPHSHRFDTPRNLRLDLRNKKWRDARLAQLSRWKKIIQAERDSRTSARVK